jgi:hypothetical protein
MMTYLKALVARWTGLEREHELQETALRILREDVQALRIEVEREKLTSAADKAGRRIAEARLAGLKFYLCDLPPQETEVDWTKDDAKTLAAFLDGPVGERLLKHLTNRLSDYERMAIFYSRAADSALLCKRAHGFRDCRGELLRLSAAGPSPANPEPPEDALPAELENLRA